MSTTVVRNYPPITTQDIKPLPCIWDGPWLWGVRSIAMARKWVPGCGGGVVGCLSPALILDWASQPPEVKQLVPQYRPDSHYFVAFIEAKRRKKGMAMMPVSCQYGVVPQDAVYILNQAQIDKIKW